MVNWVVCIYLEVVVEVFEVSLVGRELVTVCLLLLCLLCLRSGERGGGGGSKDVGILKRADQLAG